MCLFYGIDLSGIVILLEFEVKLVKYEESLHSLLSCQGTLLDSPQNYHRV